MDMSLHHTSFQSNLVSHTFPNFNRCVANAPIPLGYDLFPTMPTFADLGTYALAATIGNNVPSVYSDYARYVMPAML